RHIHRRHDPVAVERIGDLLAGRGLVYGSGVRTARLRELVLEQLLRLLGLRPRLVEILARVPAGGPGGESDDADQKQPSEQHLPAVLEGPAPESIERGCHRDAPSLKAVLTYRLQSRAVDAASDRRDRRVGSPGVRSLGALRAGC